MIKFKISTNYHVVIEGKVTPMFDVSTAYAKDAAAATASVVDIIRATTKEGVITNMVVQCSIDH